MTVIFPEATKAQGRSAVAAVIGTLTKTAPKVADEIKANTSLTFSCFLFGDGLEPTAETNKGTAPARACDDSEREQEGRTKYSLTDIQYVYAPQGATGDNPNKLKTMLAPGTELWIVERLGLSAKNVDWAAGQKVNLHHVRVGVQKRVRVGDGEFAEYGISQSLTYLEDPIFDVALVA